MKTPEEYLENLTFNPNTLAEEVIDIIKQVQKETWNEAIDKAAESATVIHIDLTNDTEFDYTDVLIDDDVDIRVSKQSILKLKL